MSDELKNVFGYAVYGVMELLESGNLVKIQGPREVGSRMGAKSLWLSARRSRILYRLSAPKRLQLP